MLVEQVWASTLSLILATFPQSADEDINGHESPLELLYRDYGGKIQRKTDRYIDPKRATFMWYRYIFMQF